MSYDMIDHFLRNNLDDDSYAEYSAALDSLYTPQRKPLSNEEIGQAARDAHIAFCLNKHQTYEHALTRAIEAAHGIKVDA